MIVSWPNKIAAGSKSDLISAFWDVMPTIADIVGSKAPEKSDGISFLPTLLGKSEQKTHESMYWEFHENNGRQAVRKGDWKFIRYNVSIPEKITTELYNLKTDPGEETNVAAKNQKIVQEMLQIMKNSRVPSDVFSFGSESIVPKD
jgi:arylsulfatase A-like enzyme